MKLFLLILSFALTNVQALPGKTKKTETKLDRKASKKRLAATIFGQQIFYEDLEVELISKFGEKYFALNDDEKKTIIFNYLSQKIQRIMIANDPKAKEIENMPEYKDALAESAALLKEKFYPALIQQEISDEEKQDMYEEYSANNNRTYKIGVLIVETLDEAKGMIEALKAGNGSSDYFSTLHEGKSMKFYKDFTKTGVFEDMTPSKAKKVFSENQELETAISGFKKKGVIPSVIKFGNNYLIAQIFEVKKTSLPKKFEQASKEIQAEVLSSLYAEYYMNYLKEQKNNGNVEVNASLFK